ncbi:MAG: ABC transporter ATP-binding protein [Devosia sp.]
MSSLLEISNLKLDIGAIPILRDIDLKLEQGKVLGIIGESGSGKSMTALSIMGLAPRGAHLGGSVAYYGENLLQKSEAEMCVMRGRDFGMIFQEPMTALDPLQTIGTQVAGTLLAHGSISRRDASIEADRALERSGLPAEHFPRDRFPHELSGGQRQRVVIAMAIVMRPRLLIADEPTTALDVTTQATILNLLRRLVDDEGMGLMFVTHDLALVAGLASDIAVMRRGEIVEQGPTREIFGRLGHPYTRTLFAASSHVPVRYPAAAGKPVLEVEGLVRDYRLPPRHLFGRPGSFRAVDQVSFTIRRGENVGLVGESGSGKSTLARAIMALDPPQAGRIAVLGEAHDIEGASTQTRRKLQIVFQDPYGSFDPRQRVDILVSEPFYLLGKDAPRGKERQERVARALREVGLAPEDARKYIHEFSGGQRQRIAIARALIIEPALIILDEAVSALDVSIRAQILDLLANLSSRLGISFLFISHDLSVVRAITDRVLVMKAGKIVEQGRTEDVFRNPQQVYTRELIAATPNLERALAGG